MFDRLLEYCLRIIINTVALTTNNQITGGEMIEKKNPYLANYFFVFFITTNLQWLDSCIKGKKRAHFETHSMDYYIHSKQQHCTNCSFCASPLPLKYY